VKADVISFIPILEEKSDTALERHLSALGIRLTAAEARRIAKLLDRNPTIPEAFVFNSAWSEHCSYKSSKAVLRKYLPSKAAHVILGPGEDAGVVKLGREGDTPYALVVAHESHNHPSQLLPVDGAATGIGGIVRDVYCMGAEVVGVLDALRFGDPDGPSGERSREICRGVVEGIWRYGNAIGVPNVGGDTYFDPGYDENCLVNVIAVGVMRESDLVHSFLPRSALREPYAILLVGKPTDESGFGGASFASAILDEQKEERGAVQVADPFLKRVLTEANRRVMEWVRAAGAEVAWKDLGAGGLFGATSELAGDSGLGLEIDLDLVPQEWPGIKPEVLLCAETQERYALAVPEKHLARILEIYNREFELPKVYPGACAARIGRVTKRPFYRVLHESRVVCDLPLEVLSKDLEYRRSSRRPEKRARDEGPVSAPGVRESLLAVLASRSCCSKEDIYRYYDTEVQGRCFIRPGEADASVIAAVPGGRIGVAVSVDGNPRYGKLDPYYSGVAVTAEAVRNVVSVGATPLALTDCLNFGSPEDPEVFWSFEQAVRGIGEAASALGLGAGGEPVPVVSGNVSFYNESSQGKAIAPSPIVACFGKLPDLTRAVTMQLSGPGGSLFLVGERSRALGGSVHGELFGGFHSELPRLDLGALREMYRAVRDTIEEKILAACHDISDGGLAVSLAEMILAGPPDTPLGMEIELSGWQVDLKPEEKLFSEAPGFVVELEPAREEEFQKLLGSRGVVFFSLGKVVERDSLVLRHAGEVLAEFSSEELQAAWSRGLEEVL